MGHLTSVGNRTRFGERHMREFLHWGRGASTSKSTGPGTRYRKPWKGELGRKN